MRFPVSILLIATATTVPSTEAREWREAEGMRWATLDSTIQSDRNVGFTRLAAETTGILFENTLSEQAIAANRVLANGSGVAVGDFDGDGLADLFFCGLESGSTLYRNLGGWRFEDVTIKAGLTLPAEHHRGAVFADIDADRDLDLLIGTLDRGVLCFRNVGAGRFEDVTAAAGTSDDSASTTLALADVDGNGTLDLYIVNNRPSDIRDLGELNLKVRNGEVVIPRDLEGRIIYAFGQVIEYGQADRLLLNDGTGKFTSVDWTDGTFLDAKGEPLQEAPHDWGLTGTFRDINADSLPDIYVCNDYWTPDRIWINQGDGKFRAMGPDKVSKFSASSMGVDFADVNADGRYDFLVLDMLSRDVRSRKRQRPAGMPPAGFLQTVSDRPQVMRNTFFAGNDDGSFQEIAWHAGLAASEWSWSPIFTDVDLDGREDLLISAGHFKDVQDVDAGLAISRRQGGRNNIADPAARQRAFTQEKLENSRLYPPLDAPIVAFHNLGDFQFDDVTDDWGTGDLGVHHGIALGDLDGDGDLDLVANNLNGLAGIYRNESSAPRVAIRLEGSSLNKQAVGATVVVRSAALPSQKREVVIGGRYTSSSDTLLTFAASPDMTAEIRWPDGGQSIVRDLQPNRIYAIRQPSDSTSPVPEAAPVPEPLFDRIEIGGTWNHTEAPHDDYAGQPLLPFKLSHRGPGIAWIDDRDLGDTRLVVGGGRGGTVGMLRFEDGRAVAEPMPGIATLLDDASGLVNLGHGRLLIGVASYEDRNAGGVITVVDSGAGGQSTFTAIKGGAGAIAVADVDMNGRLEVAIAPSPETGRYPSAGAIRIFRDVRGGWDEDEKLRMNLPPGEFPNGMIFSDLDGDARPELIVACEWGPLRVFAFERGSVRDVTEQWGLSDHTGLWKGVTVGDFNEDGRMDLVASNWGTNSPFQTGEGEPLVLTYGELAIPGLTDLIETERLPDNRELTAARSLPEIAAAMPFLLQQFSSFKEFADTPLPRVLGDRSVLAKQTSARTLQSTVFINEGEGFRARPLPRKAQMAPAFGVSVADFDGDAHDDIFLAQNFSIVRMGWDPFDSGRGIVLKGDGMGNFSSLSQTESGIRISVDQRGAAVADFDLDGRVDLAVGINGGAPVILKNERSQRGVPIILQGAPSNPTAIGAIVRAVSNGRTGRAQQVHAGSGYFSGSSTGLTVHSEPSFPISAVSVRWPDGTTLTTEVPALDQPLKVQKTDI